MDYFNHNMKQKDKLTRRDFLKLSALAMGGLTLSSGRMGKVLAAGSQALIHEPITPDFPVNQQLGRICVGEWGTRVPIRSEPFIDAP